MSTDPDQIRSEIDQTQRELSADVDALTEKISPQRIVERRVRRTRSAMTNMKDRIMGSTSDAYQTAGSAASGVGDSVGARASAARDTVAGTASSAVDTVRSAPDTARRSTQGNPLAAGLIAFGAGWLLSALLPASEPEQRVASQVKDFAAEQGRPVAEQLGQAGQQAAQELKESAQQRAEAVRETAADAASTVTGEAQSAASDVTDQAQQAGGQVRDQGSRPGPFPRPDHRLWSSRSCSYADEELARSGSLAAWEQRLAAQRREEDRLARERQQREKDQERVRQQEHLESRQREAEEQTAAVEERMKALGWVQPSAIRRAICS